MATNKHRRKKHHKKGIRAKTVKRRRHYRRHYKRRHSNTSLKEYLFSDNHDTGTDKDTVNVSNQDTANNGNIIHGLRDLLSNKKK